MKRFVVPGIVIALAAAIVALLVYGLSSQGESRSIDQAVATGRMVSAPGAQRSLPVLGGGGARTLADYRGKVVVLNFWANWCVPCRAEAPVLEHAQHRLAAHGGTVLGVTYQTAIPDAEKFIRAHGLTYPSLRDVGSKLAEDYGTDKLPETFIIDRRGRITAVRRAQLDARWLRAHLDPLLAGS